MVVCTASDAEGQHDAPAAKSTLRRHPRMPVAIRAVLYRGNTFQPIVVRDISAGGARLHGCDCLMQNDPITIKFMSGRGINARVRWWLGGACGVQFDAPLREDDVLLSGRLNYDTLLAERRRETKKPTA